MLNVSTEELNSNSVKGVHDKALGTSFHKMNNDLMTI